MDILFNKQNEYKEKINNLKKYINNRYNNYKIIIGNYDDFILYNGLKEAEFPYALSIKNGYSNYFKDIVSESYFQGKWKYLKIKVSF